MRVYNEEGRRNKERKKKFDPQSFSFSQDSVKFLQLVLKREMKKKNN
jgi:hypothetical protein